jgi:two-component system, chemotaxis family, sensor histidine kinase and response regulator PixL
MINSDIRDHAYQFFIEEAPELLQAIEEGLLTIREEKDKAKVHGIMRAAHSIKGGAASVELEAIKTIAHRLEDIFKALYSDEVVIDSYLENLLLQGYDCLKDPLMEQIETGNYDEQRALEDSEPVFQKIEGELGDALKDAEDYIPTSADLGIDVVSSIFEVDVAQELDRLTEVVNNPHNYEVAGELRATGEVFAGFAELLNLPGFARIATVAEEALDHHHDQALEITRLAIADFWAAREQVLNGDRQEGGKPSDRLLALAQPSSINKNGKGSLNLTEESPQPTQNDDLHDHAYQFFIEEAPELLQLIEDGLLRLRQNKDTPLVHEIMRAAHSLKGGSASVGLEEIKTIAHRLEDIFKALYPDTVIIDEYLEGLLLKGYDCLRIPLMEQIETGYYNPQEALAQALPIMEDIEAQLGDALTQAEDYIPSSADLGIDVVSSLFEVDVVEGIDKLKQALADGNPHLAETELRSQVEIFDGFGELLNLPGFSAIGKTVVSALDRNPDNVLMILELALGDYEKACEDVMNGDRDRGGSPCGELLGLAGESGSESSDLNFENDEFILEDGDFDFGDFDLMAENPEENILLTVSDGGDGEFSDIFEDVILEETPVLSIEETQEDLLPIEDIFEDVILEETPVLSIEETQEDLLPIEDIFEDVILEETPVLAIEETQEDLLPIEDIFEDVILEETPVLAIEETQEDLLPIEDIFEDVILEETPVLAIEETQEDLLPIEDIFEDVILEETPVLAIEETQEDLLPIEDIFENSFITDETVILAKPSIPQIETQTTETKSLSLEDVFNEIILEETLDLDEVFNEVVTGQTPSLDDVFTKFAEKEETSIKTRKSTPKIPEILQQELNEIGEDETLIMERPLEQISSENIITNITEISQETAPIPSEIKPEKKEEKTAVKSMIDSVEKLFNQLPPAQDINQLLQQAEAKLNQVKNQKKVQKPKRKAQVSPTSNLSVRVDLNRLERMNDLVGELAINRNSLSLQNDQLQRQVQELFNRFTRFQNLTQELQKLSDKMLITPQKQQGYEIKVSNPNSFTEMQDLVTSAEEFDTLEMDRYSILHSTLQSVLEEILILEEAVDDIVLYARQSNQTIDEQRQMLTHLRDELMWARMLPLGEVLRRFPRVLRDLSHKHKKPVNLKLTGTGVLVDKAVLEKLYDPLLHLLRNAFDHGIESPEDRQKTGKPEEGTITIRAYHQGSQTIIEISDDGEGLQLDKIGKRAVERGLLSPLQLAEIEQTQLSDFIFEPGFSTAEKVSELSGRGVGLDVVRSQLRSLKGNVSVNSKPKQGTSFILSLPLTLTIAKLLVCIIGVTAIAFPSDSIEEIIVPKANQMHKSGTQRFLYWRGQAVPTYRLADLLDYGCPLPDVLPSKALGSVNTPADWALPLLIIRQENQYWALEVDRLVTEQELVVKPFGIAINPPPYIYGCTILGDGSLIPVIEGNSLIENSLEGNSTNGRRRNIGLGDINGAGESGEVQIESSEIEITPPEETSVSGMQISIPRILVVDDSAALRRTLAFSLQKAGYRVLQAKDGREALQQLQQGTTVDLVICDVEMPNMNGFEFLGQRRREASIKNIPVAMLTSRSNDKHRRLAMQLGASAYFSKPYVEQEFLIAIKDMITQKHPEMASALR